MSSVHTRRSTNHYISPLFGYALARSWVRQVPHHDRNRDHDPHNCRRTARGYVWVGTMSACDIVHPLDSRSSSVPEVGNNLLTVQYICSCSRLPSLLPHSSRGQQVVNTHSPYSSSEERHSSPPPRATRLSRRGCSATPRHSPPTAPSRSTATTASCVPSSTTSQVLEGASRALP